MIHRADSHTRNFLVTVLEKGTCSGKIVVAVKGDQCIVALGDHVTWRREETHGCILDRATEELLDDKWTASAQPRAGVTIGGAHLSITRRGADRYDIDIHGRSQGFGEIAFGEGAIPTESRIKAHLVDELAAMSRRA